MKRIIILTLAVCILGGGLISCKKKVPDSSDAATTVTTAPGEAKNPILEGIPEADLGGRDFVMMSYATAGNNTIDYESSESAITQVSYERTGYINDLMNVKLRLHTIEHVNDTYSAIRINHESGLESGYDLCLPHPTTGIVPTMLEGYCADLMSVENLSLDGQWWNQSLVENYRTNGKLYLGASDYTSLSSGFAAIVYNRTMYSDVGGTRDLYKTVNDGDWTLEVFYETVKEYQPDGEGTDPSYSLLMSRTVAPAFMYASGHPVLQRDSEDKFILAMNETKLNTIAEYLYGFVYESSNVYVPDGPIYYSEFEQSEFLRLFKDQKGLFITYDIGGLYSHLSDVSFDIGYLPLPKFDAYQSDYQVITAAGYTMIPSALSQERRDQSAAVLEGLARYSNVYMRKAFFETILLANLSENKADYDMLELLHQSKFYELGFPLGAAAKNVLQEVIFTSKSKTVTVYLREKGPIMDLIVSQVNEIN